MQGAEVSLAVRTLENSASSAEGRPTRRYDVEGSADRWALKRITHPQIHALGDGEWSYPSAGPEART